MLDTRRARDACREPAAPEPLRPLATTDEAAHTPEPTNALWNESWYFDFADPGQGVGGWVRLGPVSRTRASAWINALLCGPGMPTIARHRLRGAALPDDPADVRTADVTLIQQATEPLRSYRVAVARARGQAYDDPSALLRGEDGRPVAGVDGPGVDLRRHAVLSTG